MNGYYSVFNPDGDKIADCGAERDASSSYTVEIKVGMDTTTLSTHYPVILLMSINPENLNHMYQ